MVVVAEWWVARRCGNGEGGGANVELGVEGVGWCGDGHHRWYKEVGGRGEGDRRWKVIRQGDKGAASTAGGRRATSKEEELKRRSEAAADL
jgi:hypothetical protein